MPRREREGSEGRDSAVIWAYRLEMFEEDDRHVAHLLRQPAVIHLMLLLILGFILLVVVLMALSYAD